MSKVPLLRRWVESVTFVLQHWFPRSKWLSGLREWNARQAARALSEGTVIEVDRRSDLSEEEFVREYLSKGIPVVFDGQAAAWPCTRKWSLEFLKEQYEDEPLSVISIPGFADDGYAPAVEKAGEVLLDRISAGEFVKSIRRGAKSYLRACPLLESHPELLGDLDLGWLKRMRRCLLGVSYQSFIGSGGRTTPIHAEATAFFFVLAEGEKRWTLLPPSSSAVLRPPAARQGYILSRVRPRSPDLKSYPNFDRLSRYTCHLRKGDILFVPAWMWHEVETLTETWGVSYRFTHVRGFLKYPAFAFAKTFLARPTIFETLYYSCFKTDAGSRSKNLLVPRLFLKD